MTAEPMLPDNDPLAAALASLTGWSEADASRPTLAAAALSAVRPHRSFRLSFIPSMPRTLRFASIAALLVVGICLAAFLSPSLGRSRVGVRVPPSAPLAQEFGKPPSDPDWKQPGAMGYYQYGAPSEKADGLGANLQSLDDRADVLKELSSQVRTKDIQPPETLQRSIVRKSTLDLKVADIRAVFSKIALIPSQAQGEFTESSSLDGSPTPTGASIVLRVRAERLSAVLNELRALGEVVTEASRGEDVTDQAVDLDARLRNEQHVETELLQLLDSRKDSPLKEILELRQAISECRERIERMTAQRDQLSRLVSLATVLVNLRPSGSQIPDSAGDSLWHVFTAQLDHAWHNGLYKLTATVGWFIEVLLGGLIWWLLLGATIAAIARLRRQSRRKAAREPAPSI